MNLPKEITTVTPFSKFLAMGLFLLLPFAGFYAGMQYQQTLSQIKNSEAVVIAPTLTPTPIISVFPTTDPSITANWKTYKNEKYGYEIKYPLSAKIGFYSMDGFHPAGPNDFEVQIIVSSQVGCEGSCGVYITGHSTRAVTKNSTSKTEAEQILSTFRFTN